MMTRTSPTKPHWFSFRRNNRDLGQEKQKSVFDRSLISAFGLVLGVASLLLHHPLLVTAQSSEAVATVNGKNITLQDVDDSIASQIFPIKQQLYALRKAALNNLISSKLLEAEAAKRKISVAELRKELTTGEVFVTDDQVEESFKQNAPVLAMMSPHEAKARLRLDLESQQRMKLYRAALDTFRSTALISLYLDPPAPPIRLDNGTSPSRGALKPLVTIVEFSDFQCPYCKHVQPAIEQLLQKYPGTLKLVFKHLPLDIHPEALNAARASYCAGEQDHFWDYHNSLFNADELSTSVLEKTAAQLGLDLTRFRTCVSSSQAQTAVNTDLETARLLRIESTPSFVINGKIVNGALGFTDFQQIIEKEISKQTDSKPSSTQ